MRFAFSVLVLWLMALAAAQDDSAILKAVQDDDAKEVARLMADRTPETIVNKTDTLFSYACSCQGHKVIELLINRGAKVNRLTPDGSTSLIRAVTSWNVEGVQLLLQARADPDIPDAKGETPLLHTVSWPWSDLIWVGKEKDMATIAESLIKSGAKVDCRDNGGNTPLIFAAMSGHLEAFQVLLKSSPNLDAVNDLGQNALCWSTRQGTDSPFVKGLLSAGAKLRLVDALLLQRTDRARELVNEPGAKTERGPNGETVLLAAAAAGDVDIVRELLRLGASGGDVDQRGFSALHLAVGAVPNAGQSGMTYWRLLPDSPRRAEIVRILVKAGVSPNIQAPGEHLFGGETPLLWAATVGRVNIVKALLQAGAYPDGVWKKSWITLDSPLTTAVWYGHLNVARVLLDAGANPNVDNVLGHVLSTQSSQDGVTEPLDKVAALKMLLHAGANPNTFGSWNLLELAITGHDEKALMLLLGAGANPDLIDPYTGESTLMVAMANYDAGVWKVLRNFTPDPTLLNKKRQTARQIAVANGWVDRAKLLEKYEQDWAQLKKQSLPKP